MLISSIKYQKFNSGAFQNKTNQNTSIDIKTQQTKNTPSFGNLEWIVLRDGKTKVLKVMADKVIAEIQESINISSGLYYSALCDLAQHCKNPKTNKLDEISIRILENKGFIQNQNGLTKIPTPIKKMMANANEGDKFNHLVNPITGKEFD